MIAEWADRFVEVKNDLRRELMLEPVFTYKGLLVKTLEIMFPKHYKEDDLSLDLQLKNIHEIDDGDYQGTLLFLIPADYYQPSSYYAIKVGYGSCSICDTMQGLIDEYEFGKQALALDGLVTLAMHMIQSVKLI